MLLKNIFAFLSVLAYFFISPIFAIADLGNLTLDSTYECISVRLVTTATDYAETDLVLEYQLDGADSWTTGHPLTKVHFDNNRFFGSIFELTKDTTFNVRVKTIGCESADCWNIAQITTRNDVFTSGTNDHFYVATNGRDSYPGTEAEPFATIQHAEDVSGPGDVIHILPGTYYETITVENSGSAGNYIKYVGEGDVYISGAYASLDTIDGDDNWTYHAETNSYRTYIGERTFYVGYRASGEAQNQGHRLYNYRQKTYTLTNEENPTENFEDLSFASEGIEGGFWSADDGYLYVHLPNDADPDTVNMMVAERQYGFYLSADYIVVDNVNIGYCGDYNELSVGVQIQNSSNNVVQNCDLYHVETGVAIQWKHAHDNTVQDNNFYDDVGIKNWPWSRNKAHDTETAGVVMTAGGGNVVRRNNMHHTFNGIVPGSWGMLNDEEYNFNVDVHDNTLVQIGDDCLEPEGANINTRMWDNVCRDVHVGISLAPITVGPLYVIRTQVLNAGQDVVKMANSQYGPGRAYIYHTSGYKTETSVALNTLSTSGASGNLVFRNNAFYGHRYAWESTNTMYLPMDWDYDCIHTTGTSDPAPSLWGTGNWYDMSQEYVQLESEPPLTAPTQAIYRSNNIAEFYNLTGCEAHGIDSDPLFADMNNHDVRLQSNSPCRDKGVIIANINNTRFKGSAPDIGAIEYDDNTPVDDAKKPQAPQGLKIVPPGNPDPDDPDNPDPDDPDNPDPDDPDNPDPDDPDNPDPDDPDNPDPDDPDNPLPDDFTAGNWLMLSPSASEPSPSFGWEYAGVFDSVNRKWIHYGGHDAGHNSVQAFCVWTYDIDGNDWQIQFAPDGPPGSCCVDGGSQFDTANQCAVFTVGAYLSHGFQWIRSINMRGNHIWLYDAENNEWTDPYPPALYDRTNQGIDAHTFARLNIASTYAEEHQATYFFGGTGWGGSNQRLHYYDAYTNELVKTNAANPPPSRDNAGLSYDDARDKIYMFGSQYTPDLLTWTYSPSTNAWTSIDLTPRPPGLGAVYASTPSMDYDPIHDLHVLVAFAGTEATNVGHLQTWAFDAETSTWAEMAATEPDATDITNVRARNLHFSPDDNTFFMGSQAYEEGETYPENRLWTFRAGTGGTYQPRPQAPTVTTDADSVLVRWSSVAGADTYKIYRATGSVPRTFTEITQTASTSYDDTDVAPGTTYYYRVSSIDNEVESRQSFFARSQPRVMPAPVVSARADYDVDVKWTAHSAADIAGYNIYRGIATIHTNTTIDDSWPDNKWSNTRYDEYPSPVVTMVRNITDITKLNTSLITGTSYRDTTANIDTLLPESYDYGYAVYAYIIKAVNHFGVESGSSPYQITIPSAPKNVLLNTNTNTIKWDAAVEDNVIGYNIYQYARTENGGSAPVNKVNTSLVASPYTLPAASYHIFDRFWVVPVDSLGQEGVPSVPIWYGDRYAGFYTGDWHQ